MKKFIASFKTSHVRQIIIKLYKPISFQILDYFKESTSILTSGYRGTQPWASLHWCETNRRLVDSSTWKWDRLPLKEDQDTCLAVTLASDLSYKLHEIFCSKSIHFACEENPDLLKSP